MSVFQRIVLLAELVCAMHAATADTAQIGFTTPGNAIYDSGGMAVVSRFDAFKHEDSVECAIVNPAGTTAWLGVSARPHQIFQFDIATMRKTAALTIEGNDGLADAAIDPAGTFGYFVISSSPFTTTTRSRVIKLNLASMTIVQTFLGVPGESLGGIVIDAAGANLYVLGYTFPADTRRLIRISTATFTQTGALPMTPGASIMSLAMDNVNNLLYASERTTTTILRKIELISFSLSTGVNLGASNNGYRITVNPAGTFAYAAAISETDIRRVKLDSTGTTNVIGTSGILHLDDSYISISRLCIDGTGTQGIITTGSGHIMLIDLSAYNAASTTQIGPFTHLAGITISSAGPQTIPGNRVLILGSFGPGWVDRVDFSLAHTGPTFFEGGEYELKTIVADADGRFGYIVPDNSFGGLVKVDLLRNRRIGRRLLDPSFCRDNFAVTDGRNVFVGINAEAFSFPEELHLFKIDMETMSELQRTVRTDRRISGLDYNPSGNWLFTTAFGIIEQLNANTLNTVGSPIQETGKGFSRILSNPNVLESFYIRDSDKQIEKIGASKIHSGTFSSAPTSLLRSPATGVIYTAIDPGIIKELDPNNLTEVGSVDISGFDTSTFPRLNQGLVDPLGRYLLHINRSNQLVKHELNVTGRISALALHHPFNGGLVEGSPYIDPDGVNAYYGDTLGLNRVAMTPRGRLEGVNVSTPGRIEVNTMHFYARQVVGPRRVEVLPLGYLLGSLRCGFIDRPHNRAWFGTNDSPGKVIQFDCATRDVVNSVTLALNENSLLSTAIDPTSTFGYFGTNTSPGKLVKVRLSDNTRVDVRTLSSGENSITAIAIDSAGQFAYCATGTAPSSIIKFRLSDFTRVGQVTLANNENNAQNVAIDSAGNFLYATTGVSGLGGLQSNPRIVKIQLNPSFSRIDFRQLSADSARGMAIDPAGAFAVVTGGFNLQFGPQEPGLIERVRLSDFTLPGPVMTLNADEPSPGKLAFTPDGTALLVAQTGGKPKVIKIDWPSFARNGEGPLRPATEGPVTSVLIGSDSMAYLGIGTIPARILTFEPFPKPLRLGIYSRVDDQYSLAWQSAPLAIPTGDAWIDVPISQGVPAQLTLSAKKVLLAWQCDADQNVPSHLEGNFGDGLQFAQPFGSFTPALSTSNAATSWTTTSSRWTMYLDTTSKNSARDWERFP